MTVAARMPDLLVRYLVRTSRGRLLTQRHSSNSPKSWACPGSGSVPCGGTPSAPYELPFLVCNPSRSGLEPTIAAPCACFGVRKGSLTRSFPGANGTLRGLNDRRKQWSVVA